MIYAPHRRHGFARATAVLDQLGLNILDARITPVGNGFSLDSYHVLEEDGTPDRRVPSGAARSSRRCGARCSGPKRRRWWCRGARRGRCGCSRPPPRSSISVDERNRRSVLELTAGDRPGLLCDVGKVLWEERVDLHAAKISTLGERAEDVFYLTDRAQQPLDEAAAERLRTRLARRARSARGMNPGLARLRAYPFERLQALLAAAQAPSTLTPIALSIGEPKHDAPGVRARDAARQPRTSSAAIRPPAGFRSCGRPWRARCSAAVPPGTQIDPDRMVLPVTGTREGLFALVQAVVAPASRCAGRDAQSELSNLRGCRAAGRCRALFLNTTGANGFRPDLAAVPASVWQRCALLFLCSPG